MILTDIEILTKIQNKEINITPTPKTEQIQPASIDLRLSNEFLQPIYGTEVDTKNSSPKYEYITTNRMTLPPHSFLLASTKENITIPSNMIARVEGRSSIGRLGVTIHVTAGFIDPGFEGNITLEIANLSNTNVILYEDMRICQIVFEELTSTPEKVYGECGNKYQNQRGVTGSMLFYEQNQKWGEVNGKNNPQS